MIIKVKFNAKALLEGLINRHQKRETCLLLLKFSQFFPQGVVPRESSTEEEVLERRQKGEEIRYCKKCRSIKPDRAHHCRYVYNDDDDDDDDGDGV